MNDAHDNAETDRVMLDRYVNALNDGAPDAVMEQFDPDAELSTRTRNASAEWEGEGAE